MARNGAEWHSLGRVGMFGQFLEVMLNTQTGHFSCEFNNDTISRPTLPALKAAVAAMVALETNDRVQTLACEMYVEHQGSNGVDAQKARAAWGQIKECGTPKYFTYVEWSRTALDVLSRLRIPLS